jgi:AcrR family transcriptional regulator
MGSPLFDDEPADTREAIMQATYRALRAHGYARLTIQRIGDEFPKSKSLLYHHYDGKDDLLLEFLSYMLDWRESLCAEPRLDVEMCNINNLVDLSNLMSQYDVIIIGGDYHGANLIFQTNILLDSELQEENAETSLDQPSQ